MKHEFLDHHRDGDSIVHLADPRLKVMVMFIFIFIIVLIPYRYKYYFMPLALMPVLLAFLSGISLFHYLSKVLKIYPMIFFITFLLPFFSRNDAIVFKIGGLKIFETGLQNFLLINVKSVLAMFMSVILTTTTEFNSLLKGLEKLRVPQIFIIILSFMYRFIFLLIDEIERMMMAYQSRYIKMSFFSRIKTIAQQIGVVFIRTYERGERVYQAMDSRGFSGEIYTLSTLSWKKTDTFLLATFISALLLIFISKHLFFLMF